VEVHSTGINFLSVEESEQIQEINKLVVS